MFCELCGMRIYKLVLNGKKVCLWCYKLEFPEFKLEGGEKNETTNS